MEIGHGVMLSESGEVTFQGGQDDFASDPDLANLCDGMAWGDERTDDLPERGGPRARPLPFDADRPDASRSADPEREDPT